MMKKITISLLAVATIVSAGLYAQSRGPIVVEEDRVVAEIKGAGRVVGYLASSDDPFFGFGPTYAFNPAGDAIAFIGEERGTFGLYVYQAGERSAALLPDYGEITGRTLPVWSGDGNFLTYSLGNRIWLYDTRTAEARVLTEPEDQFYEDIDPEFSDDGRSILFYRGTTFEYSFSGDRFEVDLDGSGLTWVEEDDPKYPPEYFGGPDDGDPYISSSILLIESKAALFAMDLENHDYERLITYFPAWYVIMALEMSGDLGIPVDEDIFANFFFNGAVIYEDYSNQIRALDSIKRVIGYEVLFFDLEVYFTVELYDGREVVFYLVFDQDSLQFSGAFG